MSNKAAFWASQEGAGMRLDKLVVEAAAGWSRGGIQRAIRAGEILVDGKRAAPGFRVSAGQRIEYPLQPPKPEAPAARTDTRSDRL